MKRTVGRTAAWPARVALFARPRRRLAAFDINNYAIKLVVARRGRGAPVLERFHVERLEESETGGTVTLDEVQREAIRRMVDAYGLRGCDAVASLPYASYTLRLVVLPRMPRRELRGAIRLDLRQHARYAEARHVFEYVTVDAFEQDRVAYENHLVAIVERERLAELAAFLREVGLRPLGFCAAPLALRNVLAADVSVARDAVVAVVNMSHEETSFSLIENEKLLFTREIPHTGRELIDALQTIVVPEQETIHLSRERATEIKFEYGVIDEASWGETTDEGIPLEYIAIMMRPVLEKLLVEIRRSIDFCGEQFGMPAPQKIFLAGGGSQLKNLIPFMASRLRIEVEHADPLRGLALDPLVDRATLAVASVDLANAIGAALGVARPDSFFAPAEFVASDYGYLRLSLRVAAAAAVLAAGSAASLAHLEAMRATDRIAERAATLTRLEDIRAEYESAAEELKLQRFRRETLLSLLGREVPWGPLLKDVSRRVGPEVQLVSMETVRRERPETGGVVEDRVRFQGLISLEHDRVETVASELFDSMNESPYFDDLQLEDVRALGPGVASVDFSCRLLY